MFGVKGLQESVKKNVALYQGQLVIVTLDDDTEYRGRLLFANAQDNSVAEMLSADSVKKVFVDEQEVELDDICDLRYVGKVTDYHTSKNTATIDEYLEFEVADTELWEKLRYKEFECTVSAHLVLTKKQNGRMKVGAESVKLLEAQHVIYAPTLLDKVYLYRIANTWKKCILKQIESQSVGACEVQLVSEDGKQIALNEVQDITKMPAKNNQVTAFLKNVETKIKGVVTAIYEDGFLVVNQNEDALQFKKVEISEIEKIVFHGAVTSVEQWKIDGLHSFKEDYIAGWETEGEEALSQNRTVQYVSGVNERGLVAKDIYVEKEFRDWRYGVVIPIGSADEITEGLIAARRNRLKESVPVARYKKSQLGGLSKLDFTNRFIIVQYLSEEQEGEKLSFGSNVKVVNKIDWNSTVAYAVEVNQETGEILYKMPYHTAEGLSLYAGQTVDVTYLEAGEECHALGVLSIVENGGPDKVEEWSIRIEKKNNGSENNINSGTEIAVSQIRDILVTSGVVSVKNENSNMAWIRWNKDHSLAFRENDMADKNAFVELKSEDKVAFRLGVFFLSTKGTHRLSAYDVSVIDDAKIKDVWVVSFGENSCKVIGKDVYADGTVSVQTYYDSLEEVEVQANGYKLSDWEQEGNVSDCLYAATMKVYEDTDGNISKKLVEINRTDTQKRKFYKGRIGAFMGNHGYVMDWKNRELTYTERSKNRLDLSYRLENVKKLNGEAIETLDINQFTYDVLYEKGEKDRKSIAEKVYITEKTERDNGKTGSGLVIKPVRQEQEKKVREIVIGETFGYKTGASDKLKYTTVKAVSDDKKYVIGEDNVKVEASEITRFGIFAGLDCSGSNEAEYKGYLDGDVVFPLKELEQKTKNEIMTDPMMMLLSYSCNENGITNVSRVKNLDTVSWEKAKLIRYSPDDKGMKKRECIIEFGKEEIKYYSHTSTNGAVNAILKDMKQEEKKGENDKKNIYVKTVKIAKMNPKTKTIKIETVVGEIRLEEERTYIDQKTDEYGKRQYTATRVGTTERIDVSDKAEKYYHMEVKMKFEPDSKDPTILIPTIDNVSVQKEVFRLETAPLLYANEDFIGKKRADIVKILERKIEDFLTKTESKGEAEFNYIACTLQKANRIDKRYLIDLFRTLKDTCTEEINGNDEKETFVNLLTSVTWNDQTVTKFIQKVVMIDEPSMKWMGTFVDQWMGDSLAEAICERCKYLTYAIPYSAETKKSIVLDMLDKMRFNLYNNEQKWIREVLEDFNEGNVVRQLVGLKGIIDNLEADDAHEWKYSGAEKLMLFLDLVHRLNEETKAGLDKSSREQRTRIDCLVKELAEWIQAQNNRTRWMTEIILCATVDKAYKNSSVPKLLATAIENRLESAYGQECEPELAFALVDDCIFEEQKELRFYITNGEVNAQERRRYKAAKDIKVEVCLCINQSEGKKVVAKTNCDILALEQYTDDGLECYMGSMQLDKKMKEYGKQFFVEVKATHSDENVKIIGAGTDGIFKIDGIKLEPRPDYSSIENPYPEDGRELEALSEMFFGRQNEKLKIHKCLINEENEINVVKIFIHGQRRCGKSSVVSQFISKNNKVYKYEFDKDGNAIGAPVELNNTIAIKFDVPRTKKIDGKETKADVINDFYVAFEEKLYSTLLTQLGIVLETRGESERLDRIKELGSKMKESVLKKTLKKISETYKELFTSYISELKEYSIVCVIDEFTNYCAAVPNAFSDAFKFMDDLTAVGISQIYIGHELMKKELLRLDVINETTAKNPEIPMFDFVDKDAEAMLVTPFIEAVGLNPFEGAVCGRRTVQKVLYLSGCNPFILSKICRVLFEHYKNKQIKYLTEADVMRALEETVLNEEHAKEYEDWFDAFFVAKGDSDEDKKATKKYLSLVATAEKMTSAERTTNNPLAEWQSDEKKMELLDRRVIVGNNNNNLRIRVGLLKEYLWIVPIEIL